MYNHLVWFPERHDRSSWLGVEEETHFGDAAWNVTIGQSCFIAKIDDICLYKGLSEILSLQAGSSATQQVPGLLSKWSKNSMWHRQMWSAVQAKYKTDQMECKMKKTELK